MLFVATDLVGTWLSALSATNLRFPVAAQGAWAKTASTEHIGIVFLFSILIVLFAHTQSLYARHPPASALREFLSVLGAILLASALLVWCLLTFGINDPSRFVLLCTALQSLIVMAGWRYRRRQSIRRAVALGIARHNILLVGTDSLARRVRTHLYEQRQLGCVVVGHLATDSSDSDEDIRAVLGQFRTMCRTHFVDEVIICSQARAFYPYLVLEARKLRVGLRLIPDVYDGAWPPRVEFLGDIPTIPIVNTNVPAVSLKLKRIMDVLISAAALVLLSPCFLGLAMWVKLDSDGPAFYRSQRVGKKGRHFSCLKFRTMQVDAEALRSSLEHLNERKGILFKIKNDPRVTRSGRIMRKYSLDELLQLWNVLKGDMSLVGPRPPLVSEVQQYELGYLKRLNVAPGITGLWQVEARTSPSFESYIALDLRYVENWSVLLDLRILFRTIAVVFGGTGV